MPREPSSLVTDAQKVLDEGAELCGSQRLSERGGHDPIGEAGYHERARLLDRLGDVLDRRLASRLAELRRGGGQRVQVRAHGAGGARVGELVAAPAAVGREQRLAL